MKTDLRATVKEVSGGAGRGSFNSLPVEFGIGLASAIEKIRIRWPSGIVQTLTGVGMDQILPVTEPCTALTLFAEADLLIWFQPSMGPGVSYDVVRGDLTTLRVPAGDFKLATLECLTPADLETNSMTFGPDPSADDGFWFLVRANTVAGSGSYDAHADSQVGLRDAEINSSVNACP